MDFAGLFSEHMMPDKLHSINLSFHVDSLDMQFGGCAGNIAYSLALLGEEPEIIAMAGNDFGAYRAHLMRSGVDPSSIHTVEDELTSSAYILTDKADNQIAAFHGGAGDRAYDIPVEVEGRALAIIAPGCTPDMRDLPKYYREHKMKYIYDPAQQITTLTPEMLIDGMTGALILFGSDYEYALIQQKTGFSEEQILEKVSLIVVTYAAKGSELIAKTGKVQVAACPAQAVVDPTGAGDAYRAGFIKGMMLGLPYESCAKLGSTVAAFCVETYGTQTHKFTKEDVIHRYKQTYGETLSI